MEEIRFMANIDGSEKEIRIHRTTNDYCGNPRYLIHWIDLGLKDYKSTKLTRLVGLCMYRGKSYGGGFVFQSYSLENDLLYILKKVYATNNIKIKEI